MVVSALGHSYECTEDGNDRIYTCTRCGDTYTEAICRRSRSNSSRARPTPSTPKTPL